MTSEILASVAKEPSLLRWLHSHDPDRDLSQELLDASATYSTTVPQTETADITQAPVPPTSSLFVPMYRREHFILGQLYGPMSPNAMALNILAKAGYGSPPNPISRRFVVDLSFDNSLQFIEYEWFSDGKLCVSMHKVTSTGQYDGQSILLGGLEPGYVQREFTKDDLFAGHKRPASPTKVLMRMYLSEAPGCVTCGHREDECLCNSRDLALLGGNRPDFEPPNSWETWLGAFGMSRMGIANMTLRFVMTTPMGDVEGNRKVRLQQTCEVGVKASSPKGNTLLLMFMQSAGMLVSAPNMDQQFVAAEERKELYELANDLSKEEDCFPPPQEVTLSVTDCLPAHLISDAEGSIHTSTALLHEDSLLDACLTPPSDGIGWHHQLPENQTVHTNGIVHQKNVVTPSNQHVQGNAVQQTRAIERDRGIQRESRNTRRRARNRDKVFVCECGKVFTHKGHYNEHRLCVHEKVRQHECLFENCSSRFFKRSDRDRHMRAKHDSAGVSCSTCGTKVPNRTSLNEHIRREHPENG